MDDGSGRYYDRQFRREAFKLLPGDYRVAQDGRLFVTVLGSCVAACLRDPRSGVAGMNHFLLPAGDGRQTLTELPARYGVQAMELLIGALQKLGASRQRLEAKLFGGATVLDGLTQTNVGEQNIAFVRTYLEREGIAVVAEDLGGTEPRRVYFFTDSGQVMVRRLRPAGSRAVVREEARYRDRVLRQAPEDGGVELFNERWGASAPDAAASPSPPPIARGRAGGPSSA